MAKNSKIEWTQHTFNPWWGCVKVSPACKNCYAETWARRVGQELWGAKSHRRFFSDKHWHEPMKWNEKAKNEKKKSRVFCASMADVFEARKELNSTRERLWKLIEDTPWLDWLLLTKRPQNIAKYSPWTSFPENVWLGTTVENNKWAEKRIPELVSNKAKIHFISAEPLLGPLDLSTWLKSNELDWIIAGGESGSSARPTNPTWVRQLRDQCEKYNTPFHFKQWGHWSPYPPEANRNIKSIEIETTAGTLERMYALGKKASGRQLDGQKWDGIPKHGQ